MAAFSAVIASVISLAQARSWIPLTGSYNVTPSAAYQYAPAYKRYGNKINAVHFIGKSKPWSNLLYRPAGISNVKGKEGVFDCELPHPYPGLRK